MGIQADPLTSPSDEFVVIAGDRAEFQDMTDWTLTNEAGDVYTFLPLAWRPMAMCECGQGPAWMAPWSSTGGTTGRICGTPWLTLPPCRDAGGNIVSLRLHSSSLTRGYTSCPVPTGPWPHLHSANA